MAKIIEFPQKPGPEQTPGVIAIFAELGNTLTGALSPEQSERCLYLVKCLVSDHKVIEALSIMEGISEVLRLDK
jgi:hypothetical protein